MSSTTITSLLFEETPRVYKGSSSGLRIAPAAVFLIFLAVAALAPQFLSHTDPLAIDPRNAFQPPGYPHPFGTDPSGRDVFSRAVYGARQSILIGIAAISVSMSLAVLLGLVGGLGGQLAERLVRWLIEIMFSFPALVLALLVVASVGVGVKSLIIAIGIGSAPGYARLVFGQVLTVRHSAYVEAARALGHPPLRIVRRHILPNAMRPLIVIATMGIGQAIVWSSGLSFLGLGARPPAPEWGTMLSVGRDFVVNAWWLTFFPGLFIVLTTLSTSSLGRFLQRRMEGRL